MRAFVATSLGAATFAALVVPLALPAGANPAPAPAAAAPGAAAADVPGSTQSLPLVRLGDRDRVLPGGHSGRAGKAAPLGMPVKVVRPFSLVGVVWSDAEAELHGQPQVRTRATGSHRWGAWQDVQTHYDDAPDLDAPERRGDKPRGGTAPLWVGDSDAVQMRIAPEQGRQAVTELPDGMRLELVDPGRPAKPRDPAPNAAEGQEAADSAEANAGLAQPGAAAIPAAPANALQADLAAAGEEQRGQAPLAQPQIGPRPQIITRIGWGANEQLREPKFGYTKTVKAAFVHHSATGNGYSCNQSGAIVRGIYRYHVKSNHWRDLGYNFLIDKCGAIFEGRAGGVARPVIGAHTLGFNNDTTGIAVIGTFDKAKPPAPALDALGKLTAWKLGLHGRDPNGKATLTSAGNNRYKKGTKVRLNVISGHRDGYVTSCPGAALYGTLGSARTASARFQGR
ncbi:peptidoglycan recognition protein family protein [Streptomyces violens]|uniref:peptidoglycan recognition protein family protein n=1 Tax=Streptomyces violens TaxID=66377 RepID=UPI0004C164B3|nr:peptidoglycan recognition protein [Streptomyces violens]